MSAKDYEYQIRNSERSGLSIHDDDRRWFNNEHSRELTAYMDRDDWIVAVTVHYFDGSTAIQRRKDVK